MMTKKSFIIVFIILAGVIFGFFLFNQSKRTFYIKNNVTHLSIASISQEVYQAEDKIGDLSNNIIPKIITPENLTESFAELLAKDIIGKNNQPKNNNSSTEPGLNVPDANKIAEEFIKNGLIKANKNILNIKNSQIEIAANNSKEATEIYLTETQKILKDALKSESLISILEEINKNKGQGIEKLLPIISAHETAANQIEKKPVPSSLKDLITEEIHMLRITANVLRALVNIETDPIATIVAVKQFGTILENWINLQDKFDVFIKKLNQAQ